MSLSSSFSLAICVCVCAYLNVDTFTSRRSVVRRYWSRHGGSDSVTNELT